MASQRLRTLRLLTSTALRRLEDNGTYSTNWVRRLSTDVNKVEGEATGRRSVREQNRERALAYLQQHTNKDKFGNDVLAVTDDDNQTTPNLFGSEDNNDTDEPKYRGSSAKELAQRRMEKYIPHVHGRIPSTATICEILEREHGAKEVVTIDVSTKSVFTNWFIIATGLSESHVVAIADGLRQDVLAAQVRMKSTDLKDCVDIPVVGRDCGDWVVVDIGEIVVHVMTEETRANFELERIWSDQAPSESVGVEDDEDNNGGANVEWNEEVEDVLNGHEDEAKR